MCDQYFSHATHKHSQATGIKLGFSLQKISAFITAVIIAFVASWELTLVVVFLFPVFATVAKLQRKSVTGRSVENKKRQEASGQTVVESITNIRTVAGLGVEDRFLNKFINLQEESFKLVCMHIIIMSAMIFRGSF